MNDLQAAVAFKVLGKTSDRDRCCVIIDGE